MHSWHSFSPAWSSRPSRAPAATARCVKAVKAGDLQVVRSLVKSGTDVNAASGDGSTPLLWAATRLSRRDRRALHRRRAPRWTPPTTSASLRSCRRAVPATSAMVDLLLQIGRQSVARASGGRDAAPGGGARPEAFPRCACCSRAASTSNAAEKFQKTDAADVGRRGRPPRRRSICCSRQAPIRTGRDTSRR